MATLIAVLPGDGIGPEVTAQAIRVLQAVAPGHDLALEFAEGLIGGAALDAGEPPLPPATAKLCDSAAGVLLGAVGGPKWSDPEAVLRPEQGLLDLRATLGVFANLRPVKPHPALLSASPIRAELLADVDIMVVRELTGGIYFGKKTRSDTDATDECRYTVAEIERIVHVAANLARARSGRIVSVDKANVLETSRLWRQVTTRIMAGEYPDLELEHMLVDAAAMHLLSRPASFDVILTENMFGDILTDEASMLAGSLGLLPSASLGVAGRGLYEPIHGSAPDIAGRGIANPCATILSAALLLRHSLDCEAAAGQIEQAVFRTLDDGLRTADLAGGAASASTQEFGDAVLARL
ncbi:MAG: 3-isopropylmalate dehydrogenase [Gammaproteobacteria bacterium]|nr:3-isopropylmalate dehydrogenase [Gammaproteobacteria bacterium]